MPPANSVKAGWLDFPPGPAQTGIRAATSGIQFDEHRDVTLIRENRATMTSNTDREQLRKIILERSMRFGEFVLSSGATSNYYVDVRKTSLHPEGLRLISRLLYDALRQDNVTAVGGLTLGADPLIAGVVLYGAQMGTPLEGFLVRRITKDHGLRGQVEGNLAGHKRVAILDDVTTSGESSLIAAEAAESYKAKVVRVLTVVDRDQGASQIFQQRGYPFTVLFSIGELLPAQRG